MIKDSFHQGSIYVFDTQTAGQQCVPNCIVFTLLQVHEIGNEIYVFGQTFQITIENEYNGT